MADVSLPIGLEYSQSFNSVMTTGIATHWPLESGAFVFQPVWTEPRWVGGDLASGMVDRSAHQLPLGSKVTLSHVEVRDPEPRNIGSLWYVAPLRPQFPEVSSWSDSWCPCCVLAARGLRERPLFSCL